MGADGFGTMGEIAKDTARLDVDAGDTGIMVPIVIASSHGITTFRCLISIVIMTFAFVPLCA